VVRAVTGVDLYEAWLDVLHGRRPNETVRSHGYAVRRCIADVDGRVTEVEVAELPPEHRQHHLLTRCFVRLVTC
jgi:hypothetical protein